MGQNVKRKIVMFDIDGVLADFVRGFTEQARKMFPAVPVTHTVDQPRWDGFPGMTKEQVDLVWKSVSNDPTFWYNLKPLASKYTFESLNFLTGETNVYFTTARHGLDVTQQTKDWLHEQGIYAPNVILVSRKGEIAMALQANYLIDDKAGNAVYAEYHNKDRGDFRSYLLDRPYNQFDAEAIGSKVKRVKQVEEFLQDVWKQI